MQMKHRARFIRATKRLYREVCMYTRCINCPLQSAFPSGIAIGEGGGVYRVCVCINKFHETRCVLDIRVHGMQNVVKSARCSNYTECYYLCFRLKYLSYSLCVHLEMLQKRDRYIV